MSTDSEENITLDNIDINKINFENNKEIIKDYYFSFYEIKTGKEIFEN